MTTESLWRPWSLRGLVADLAGGRMTAVQALEWSSARISKTEPALRAWVRHAHEVQPAAGGPLAGIPLGVKDIIDVAGLPTRCGSQLRADANPAAADAAIITAWRRAGAVPIGKTVTTEFAYFAPGPTQNPAAPGHTPGGSSSGSAAAVAAGQVPLALGSQTAGSVTRPAAFSGISALVLTHGRYPLDGVTGLSPSLDSHGVYAAQVSDVALAWSALTGEPDPAAQQPAAPRLLVWTGAGLGVEPPMRAALDAACDELKAAGARVEEFPHHRLVTELTTMHLVVMAYEAARERAAELAQRSQLSQPLANLLATGAATTERQYRTAATAIARAGASIAAAFADYDAILGPAALGAAPVGLAATGDPVASRAWQALGLPTVTVPGMRDAQGLPLGLQIVGSWRREAALLRVGCWVEEVLRGLRH
jgi:Asp-tRNA(Asn)/Glu-tRNA(Gln) amidotransferase A subunit family amidase